MSISTITIKQSKGDHNGGQINIISTGSIIYLTRFDNIAKWNLFKSWNFSITKNFTESFLINSALILLKISSCQCTLIIWWNNMIGHNYMSNLLEQHVPEKEESANSKSMTHVSSTVLWDVFLRGSCVPCHHRHLKATRIQVYSFYLWLSAPY